MSDLRERLDDLRSRRSGAPPPPVRRAPLTLAEALGGAEHATSVGACWRIETPFAQIAAGAEHLRLEAGLDLETATTPCRLNPARTLVLDIETGGFAGAPVFLIGVAHLGARPPRVVQWLALDYPEEPAILHALREFAPPCDAWVTFNGRSFDEPFLRDRAALHRAALPWPQTHFDVLHAARRRWKHTLPDCRLGTLEAHILGRPRVGDVPSRDVPDLFHHFMRTGHAGPLRPVLEHNRLDLVAAAELLARLAQAEE